MYAITCVRFCNNKHPSPKQLLLFCPIFIAAPTRGKACFLSWLSSCHLVCYSLLFLRQSSKSTQRNFLTSKPILHYTFFYSIFLDIQLLSNEWLSLNANSEYHKQQRESRSYKWYFCRFIKTHRRSDDYYVSVET